VTHADRAVERPLYSITYSRVASTVRVRIGSHCRCNSAQQESQVVAAIECSDGIGSLMQDHDRQIDKTFLRRTAGPYIPPKGGH
jgi:hypothetical protein